MPKSNKIHKSLYKPVLFVGCERLPFTLVTVFLGFVLLQYQSIGVIFSVLVLYLLSVALIRRVNQYDSQFFLCVYRFLLYYQDYYPVHAFYPGLIDKPQSKFF